MQASVHLEQLAGQHRKTEQVLEQLKAALTCADAATQRADAGDLALSQLRQEAVALSQLRQEAVALPSFARSEPMRVTWLCPSFARRQWLCPSFARRQRNERANCASSWRTCGTLRACGSGSSPRARPPAFRDRYAARHAWACAAFWPGSDGSGRAKARQSLVAEWD